MSTNDQCEPRDFLLREILGRVQQALDETAVAVQLTHHGRHLVLSGYVRSPKSRETATEAALTAMHELIPSELFLLENLIEVGSRSRGSGDPS